MYACMHDHTYVFKYVFSLVHIYCTCKWGIPHKHTV